MKIIRHKWDWAGPLTPAPGRKTKLFQHHTAGWEKTVEQIHESHKRMGDKGIPYSYVILNGEIHEGRPEDVMGAHTLGYNDQLAIAVVGKYHLTPMGLKNRKAARELTQDIHRRHKGIQDYKHRDVCATACPGRFYPFAYITKPAVPAKVARRDYPRLKVLMRDFAREAGIELPRGYGWRLPNWGTPARKLAWRVSGRIAKTLPKVTQSQWPTVELAAALGMKKYQG